VFCPDISLQNDEEYVNKSICTDNQRYHSKKYPLQSESIIEMKKLFLTLSVLLLAVSGLSAIYVKQQGQSAAFVAGELGAQYHGGVVINGTSISSPILKGAVSGAIGGAAGGYVVGFTAGMITTGDIRQANKAGLNGLYSGAAIGGITGSMSGYKYAKDNNINPWTGKEITINSSRTNNISSHAKQRAIGRYISQSDITDALENPLKVQR
jgi:hypothetical protein